ncbi:thioredoxin [Aspergillus campestris IBT 28561]|uniref:Thioredoxin n=1 Tax=Aspergillus campestris (strain IBT 28561) TaxID=1392248 RepID=A0A2I1CR29_ASPC2|nr:thioredoxin [Aspergillus campestris IBT 28561]PKY00080.1 thioredoxin [Aspergillus campestris IBT 28561]
MDVELYVYDLSKGLARMYSLPLTGTQIDAIYHTSLVVSGVEYYFGHGIQTAAPGSTHHGEPIEKVHLGATELPVDVISEYVQSLNEIYSPESYDLFLHNCNNFTQDLAMFLVGKSIPEHIRNLPQKFLETPFGQMMKPQIEMALRGVTQAPGPAAPQAAVPRPLEGSVRIVTNTAQLDEHMASASESCAVIFFTSATCPPCKIVYPTYDELAEEAGNKAVLIKVDLSAAYDVATRYNVRATPTFMTFLKGTKMDEWSGANPAQLRGNVRMLIDMAHPTHPHRKLDLPSLQRPISNYVAYKKVPPLEKLVLKLHPHNDNPHLRSMIDFLTRRHAATAQADVPVPSDLPSFATYLQETLAALAPETRFALVDLARLLLLDPRVAGYLAEEPNQTTLLSILSFASPDAASPCPYNFRITALQLVCNLFNTPLYRDQLVAPHSPLHKPVLTLLTNSLLDEHANLRVVAASLAYNLAAVNHNARFDGLLDPLTEEEQVELTASGVEALTQEGESAEALRGLLFTIGLLVYEAPVEGGVVDLCRAMGVGEVVTGERVKSVVKEKKDGVLIKEVGSLLGSLG